MRDMNIISSKSNSKIREILKIGTRGAYRKQHGLYIVEGKNMFAEMPDSLCEGGIVSESFLARASESLRTRIEHLGLDIVTDDVFSHASMTQTPQGILAIARQYSYTLDDILQKKEANILMLEGLQDPGNLGTIVRSGEGAGLTGIIMDEKTVDMYNPKVVRSTMGSIFRIPFIYVDDLYKTADVLKKGGITIYATSSYATDDYDKADMKLPCCFMIGNESAGLTRRAMDCADRAIRIPMMGQLESLNASISAALLMYEVARQRRG